MAIIINPDGTEQEVKPRNGIDFKMDELYRILDTSSIEIVATKDDRIMVLIVAKDYDAMPLNKKATDLYYMDDELFGKVLVCERDQVL